VRLFSLAIFLERLTLALLALRIQRKGAAHRSHELKIRGQASHECEGKKQLRLAAITIENAYARIAN
jgi:hypothetical protein